MFKFTKKFRLWFFTLPRWKKRFIKVTFDAILIPICLLLALLIRLENTNFLYNIDTYLSLIISTIIVLSIFVTRGLYNTFTRHISIETAVTIVSASFMSIIVLYFLIFIFELKIPKSVPLIYALLLCVIATSTRFFIRALNIEVNNKNRKNIVIYGAGKTGEQLIEILKWSPNYKVCQFIDDDPELQGQTIAGIKIESFDNAKLNFKHLKISTLLISFPNAQETIRQRLLEVLSEYPLQVKTIPSISGLMTENFKIAELEDLNIEDLLGRKPVKPDPKLMSKNIISKNIIVTGAGGSIGSELCRQILQWSPKKLIILDISEYSIYKLKMELKAKFSMVEIIPVIGSVQDETFVKNVLKSFAIDTIYHAAAYKHVPLMEQNVMQCLYNNVIGTLNMADAAATTKVQNFILISTDKAVKPTNFMGVSKRIAENICQNYTNSQKHTNFSVVRFGNVLGSSGSVVPLFKFQIEKGGPITLTHKDVTRYFMTITEAAQLVIQAGSIANGGETFVLDMGKPIKILELAKKMVVLTGMKPVMCDKKNTAENEIPIVISGLRHGEKLHEELTDNSNLIKTINPRIMRTENDKVSIEVLQNLLDEIRLANKKNDYKKLFQIIKSYAKDIPDIFQSTDVFVSKKFK